MEELFDNKLQRKCCEKIDENLDKGDIREMENGVYAATLRQRNKSKNRRHCRAEARTISLLCTVYSVYTYQALKRNSCSCVVESSSHFNFSLQRKSHCSLQLAYRKTLNRTNVFTTPVSNEFH